MSENDQAPINPNLGTVIAPERSVGVSEPTPEPGQVPEKKKSRRGLYTAIGSVAGLAVAAGAIFGGIALSEAPKSEPIPTAPADPTETTGPSPEVTNSPEQELTVEALQVPAGLDAEALGAMVIGDRFNAWDSAGAEDGLLQASMDANLAWSDFLPQVADKNAAIFAEALCVDGWSQDPELTHFVESSRDSNLAVLDRYKSTAWNSDEHPENLEPFRQWVTIDSVVELSSVGDERTLAVTYKNHDNSDKNMIESQFREGGVYTVTFRAVDGFEKIVRISVR